MNIDIENLVALIEESLLNKDMTFILMNRLKDLTHWEKELKKTLVSVKDSRHSLSMNLQSLLTVLHWNLLKMVCVLVLVCLKIC